MLLLAFGCQTQPPCEELICIEPERFFGEATINDSIVWRSTISVTEQASDGDYAILQNVLEGNDFLRQNLRFVNLDIRLGRQTLVSRHQEPTRVTTIEPTAYFDIMEGYDALREGYDIADHPTLESYVDIVRITENGQVIEAVFELYMILSPNTPAKSDFSIPDTLHFQGGYVTSYLSER